MKNITFETIRKSKKSGSISIRKNGKLIGTIRWITDEWGSLGRCSANLYCGKYRKTITIDSNYIKSNCQDLIGPNGEIWKNTKMIENPWYGQNTVRSLYEAKKVLKEWVNTQI